MDLTNLNSVFKGEILEDPKTLEFYSHDASLFEVKPQAVVFPKDTEDVKNLVKFTSSSKKTNPEISLTPRSAGTDMSGGAINDSIILDFTKYFNRIGSIDSEGTQVEPGVFYRDFEKATFAKNLLLPSYPASKSLCALGGMINNNSGGEKTLSHGKTIDYVIELKVVLSDGGEYTFKKLSQPELEKKLSQEDFEGRVYKQIYALIEENYDLIKEAKPKVSKNSTGYNLWDVWDKQFFDLTKLIVGAQGTLGLTTDIKLRLIELKPFSGLLVVHLNEIEKLPELISTVASTKPESFEVFDDHTMKLAIQFMPQFMRILGLKGTIEMGLQFAPDLVRFLIGGIPKFTMLIEFDDDTQERVNQRIESLQEKIKHFGLRTELAEKKNQAEKYWTIRRESFNLLRKNIKKKHTAPFIDDIIVPTETLTEFIPELVQILEKYQLLYTVAGHMGDGNFHIIPLMDLSIPSERAKIEPCSEEVGDLIIKYKGSFSAEHNEGLIRGQFLKKRYGEKMFNLFKETKRIFDPQNIFNPHKKTDSDLDFSLNHIRSHF